jgi:predicted PP-loop superfamily ATPase
MDETARHGEVMGALGRIEQKVDGNTETIQRHESQIEKNTEGIDSLNRSRARAKGVTLAATGGISLVAILATIIARAREWF